MSEKPPLNVAVTVSLFGSPSRDVKDQLGRELIGISNWYVCCFPHPHTENENFKKKKMLTSTFRRRLICQKIKSWKLLNISEKFRIGNGIVAPHVMEREGVKSHILIHLHNLGSLAGLHLPWCHMTSSLAEPLWCITGALWLQCIMGEVVYLGTLVHRGEWGHEEVGITTPIRHLSDISKSKYF